MATGDTKLALEFKAFEWALGHHKYPPDFDKDKHHDLIKAEFGEINSRAMSAARLLILVNPDLPRKVEAAIIEEKAAKMKRATDASKTVLGWALDDGKHPYEPRYRSRAGDPEGLKIDGADLTIEGSSLGRDFKVSTYPGPYYTNELSEKTIPEMIEARKALLAREHSVSVSVSSVVDPSEMLHLVALPVQKVAHLSDHIATTLLPVTPCAPPQG